MLVVLADSSILALLSRVRGRVSGCSSLLVVVSLAALVGAFASAHLQREVDLFRYSVPDRVHAVPVREALENTVAANHDKVEIVLNLEALDVWIADDYVRVASETGAFGLNISECLGYRESTWENS